MFKNSEECIKYIENIKRFSKRVTLDRMKLALKFLNNPQNDFQKVHIAGTNGKGSTLKFIDYILVEYNLKVGTFTSPYIEKFNERIQINNVFISDNDLVFYTEMIYNLSVQLVNEYDEHLTFFEVLTLICFKYFSDQKVDIALIEVGLGGLLDATNCVNYNCSVITSIGYDHMEQLGNTLEEIALNKLGIIKTKNDFLIFHESELDDIFIHYLNEAKAKYQKILNNESVMKENGCFFYDGFDYQIKMLGNHQIRNAILAIEVCKKIVEFNYKHFYEGLLKMVWLGRLQKISEKPLIYLDGAHNIDGVKVLCDFSESKYLKKDVEIIFCAMKDKETSKMIHSLHNVCHKLSVTEIDYHRCKRVSDYHEDFLSRMSLEDLIKFLNQKNLDYNKVYFITGSLYFVSFILKNIEIKKELISR